MHIFTAFIFTLQGIVKREVACKFQLMMRYNLTKICNQVPLQMDEAGFLINETR